MIDPMSAMIRLAAGIGDADDERAVELSQAFERAEGRRDLPLDPAQRAAQADRDAELINEFALSVTDRPSLDDLIRQGPVEEASAEPTPKSSGFDGGAARRSVEPASEPRNPVQVAIADYKARKQILTEQYLADFDNEQ